MKRVIHRPGLYTGGFDVAAYANVLTLYPSDEEAYTISSLLYHQVLFRFEEAFTFNQRWLARHPNDISAQADFAEKHFTTARFEECERRTTLA